MGKAPEKSTQISRYRLPSRALNENSSCGAKFIILYFAVRIEFDFSFMYDCGIPSLN